MVQFEIMETIKIILENEVRCRLNPLPAWVYRILNDKTKIFNPYARYSFAYQNRIWDGYSSFIDVGGHTFIQLLPVIIKELTKNNIPFEMIDNRIHKDFNPEFETIDDSYMSEYKWQKGHRLEGQPITLADHQVYGVNALLSCKKGLLQAATGAGKTTMLACLGKETSKYGRCLIIVPNSDLVLQTYDTLILMGVDCGRLMGQKYRELDHQTVVATWQTIMGTVKKSKGKKVNKNAHLDEEDIEISKDELDALRKDLICIVCDEAHCLTGREIFKQFTGMFNDVPLRYGLTGTIPKSKNEVIYLNIAIGDKIGNISTKELQDTKFLAQSEITVLRLYEDFDPTDGLSIEAKKAGKSWLIEKTHLQTDNTRLTFIANVAKTVSSVGNTLILCTALKTGHFIESILKNEGHDVVYIPSSMSSDKRKEQYKSITHETNKILISTMQLASTGLDIPALHRVILVDIGQSFQKTLQSIGRGLRLAKNKDKVEIYDIGSMIGSSKKHLKTRISYYQEQQHKTKIIDVSVKK